jgi:hypothetical protein
MIQSIHKLRKYGKDRYRRQTPQLLVALFLLASAALAWYCVNCPVGALNQEKRQKENEQNVRA